ncbi:MAG: hypothetical protein KGL39_04630 [Patescibacteria group bacterium]|nr:hypothetical protein [Patescibacteria group bacterium]
MLLEYQNYVTEHRLTLRHKLAHHLRAWKNAMGQVVNDSGALKFLVAVATAVTIATIIGAAGMTISVTNSLSRLQQRVDDGFVTVNQRLDVNDKRLDQLTGRIDGRP